jgi:hypothetical protein
MPPLSLQSTVVVVSAQPSTGKSGKVGNATSEEDARVELTTVQTVWLELPPVLADPRAAVGRLVTKVQVA